MSTRTLTKELLIATIGESPQVVTLALDELLRRRVPIKRVVVVQPVAVQEKIRLAITRLKAEEAFYLEKHDVRFDFCVFEGDDGHQPTDTRSKKDVEAVLQTLNREVIRAKHDGWRVHLSIAGGRKIISALGVVAAQFHFDQDDCCWHVVEGAQADRDAMHPKPDEPVILVDVPVLSWKLWKQVISGSLSLALTQNPIETEQLLRNLENRVAGAHHLRDFYFEQLNYTEQRVLALLALEGLSNDQLRVRLGCSVKNNITGICQKYGDFIKADADDRRLIADFQQIMLALQFQGNLPDLTLAGAEKPRAGRRGKA